MSATPLSEWQLLFDTITKEVHAMGFRNGGIAGEKIRITSPIRKLDGFAFTTHSGNQYVLSGDETRDGMMIMSAIWGFWKDLLDREAGVDEVTLLQLVVPVSLEGAADILLAKMPVAGRA